MMVLLRILSVAVLAWGLTCLPLAFSDADDYEKVAELLKTNTTTMGQPIAYPSGAPAEITAYIITMAPGEETGWHRHGVPLFATLLEGELTVDYGEAGSRIYKEGDALVEAVGTWHNGRSTGAGPARVLAVFIGAEGVPNVEHR